MAGVIKYTGGRNSINGYIFDFEIIDDGINDPNAQPSSLTERIGQNFSVFRDTVWSAWNDYAASGCPAPIKTISENQTVANGEIDLMSITNKDNGRKRQIFDYRLAKPRNGDAMSNTSVFAFDPNEKQVTQEGNVVDDPMMLSKEDPDDDTTSGIPSIHNWYAYVTLSGAGRDKSLFLDTQDRRRWYESDELIFNAAAGEVSNYAKDPTTSSLIQYGTLDPKGRTPYYYSDFAFCKYWRKIPNNRLITLRRYAVPTFASLDFPDFGPVPEKDFSGPNQKPVPGNNNFKPIAQAVTWIGPETGNTLESLTSFSVALPWDELKAAVHDNSEQRGDATGLPGILGAMGKTLSVFSGEATKAGAMYAGSAPPDPYEEGPYANRIMGPVNRIDSVKRRTAGLDFKHSISLQFHYTAQSIGAINTKAAMLDIMANFLLLSYGTGAFWGGANRFRGSAQSYPWKKGMAAWYKGDAVGFLDAINDSLIKSIANIADLFSDAMSDPIGTLKNIATGAAGMAMLSKSGGQQMMHGMRSLLTGEPVGEWHLVVGNPYNPIMMIGNLVCTGATFKFNDELGPDDFPTEMTVTVTLEHGMPLDRSGAESMFNKGRGRIYTLPTGVENTSAANETAVDEKTGKVRNPYVNKIMGVDSKGKAVGGRRKPRWVGDGKALDAYIEKTGKQYNQVVDDSTNLARRRELGYTKKGE